ncbi:MAG: TolC family protein [Polyangiales bacterium]|nr:TolC family protein [Myxococcales bacterium]MCB9659111.1 TolC family protein [Sandaracinaceae bacterium]
MFRPLSFRVGPRLFPTRVVLPLALVGWVLSPPSAARAQDPRDDAALAAQAGEEAASELGALAVDGSQGLDEEQVVAAALASAPSIEAARASVEAARAGARRALLGFVPEVQLGFRYTRISNIQNGSIGGGVDNPLIDNAIANVADPNARLVFRGLIDGLTNTSFPILRNQYAFTASISYPLTDLFLTVLPQVRATDAALDAQRVQAEVEQRSVTLQAREAFYEHVRAVAAQQVARDALGQAEAHRERVATLVREGAAAPVELMRVDAGVAAAQVAVAQADMGVALTLEALRALTHVQGQLEVRVAVSRSQTVPVGTLDELQEMAERERPELVALASLRDARGHQLRSARGAQYPRLAVQANFVYANPNPRVFPQRAEFTPAWDVSAVVSWSLQQTLDARQQAQSAQAQLLQLEADVQRVRDGVRLEVASAYHQLAAAEQAVMAAQAQVRAADESYRLRWAQLEAGTVVQSDVVDARLERAQAHVALLNAEIGELLARVRLRHAVTGVSAARDGAASTPSAE